MEPSPSGSTSSNTNDEIHLKIEKIEKQVAAAAMEKALTFVLEYSKVTDKQKFGEASGKTI